MSKKVLHTFTTKLGTAKRVERSRIWIEGQRLIDAGFVPGSYFLKGRAIGPRLTLTLLKDDDVINTAPCKVSGKGAKPIIDITGELVRDAFGSKGTHVTVAFKAGEIVIVPAVAP